MYKIIFNSIKIFEPLDLDNGLQPTVEIINDLYTPPVETFIKEDARVVHEPVAWVKPIIHTEGILGKFLC